MSYLWALVYTLMKELYLDVYQHLLLIQCQETCHRGCLYGDFWCLIVHRPPHLSIKADNCKLTLSITMIRCIVSDEGMEWSLLYSPLSTDLLCQSPTHDTEKVTVKTGRGQPGEVTLLIFVSIIVHKYTGNGMFVRTRRGPALIRD